MKPFPTHPDDWYRARLAEPAPRPRIVIDTDAANEIDDQFALTWALQSPDQLAIEAVYATPFSFAHRRDQLPKAPYDAPPFNPPDVGMRRSLDEIRRVFGLLGVEPEGKAFAGSAGYLTSRTEPRPSDAAEHLIALARASDAADPLYVVALGCVTNIASALIMAPDIVDRIVVVWTSAFPSHAPHVNASFNLEQDLLASQVLFDCGVPLVYLPGYHVGAQLRLSLAEVDRHVRGKGAIGDYLHQLFTHNPLWAILDIDTRQPYSWVIWDLICIAWLIDPSWVPCELVRTPRLGDDFRWNAVADRPLMREAHAVLRDDIFNDLFSKLAGANISKHIREV
ncbi:MAG: nucleoside hydrolase [Gammaproteobacteria bacterium]|nr:nucleoside hydrolase [Gammaproteobacteria bacterium]MBU1442792.1 nucleoside hydrolase [Gammaproteobacteria bacterium]